MPVNDPFQPVAAPPPDPAPAPWYRRALAWVGEHPAKVAAVAAASLPVLCGHLSGTPAAVCLAADGIAHAVLSALGSAS